MGIVERREREKLQRYNDIIDAAERVFFSKGVDNATMDEVAEVAELSKGTLYLYFKSKEDLYLAINLRGLQILESMFRKAVDSQQIGIEKVFAIGKAYLEFSKTYSNYFYAMIYYESQEIDFVNDNSPAAACASQGENTLHVVAEGIQAGIEDGSIRSDIDPMKTAFFLWGQSTGMIQLIARKGKIIKNVHGLDADKLMEYSFEMIRNSLEA